MTKTRKNAAAPQRDPLHPATARTRISVREALGAVFLESPYRRQSEPGDQQQPVSNASERQPLVLVALSGGADSLALAAATAFEAPKQSVRAGAVIVDHGLQAGSCQVAETAAEQARELGLEPVIVCRVDVDTHSDGGPEAGARRARYEALKTVAAECEANAVFTGHTHSDQAEQVLLGLARGSGARSLAGIPPRRDLIMRPFLFSEKTRVFRADTVAACAAQGLCAWEDPHNVNQQFARVRVRERVIPILEECFGPGIADALATSAKLLRDDANYLDSVAHAKLEEAVVSNNNDVDGRVELRVEILTALPAALRGRVIRSAAQLASGTALSAQQTWQVERLVTHWHGQGTLHLPRLCVGRADHAIWFQSVQPEAIA